MGVSFKMRKGRETGKDAVLITHHLKLITGQRCLRFSILKEIPMAPIFIAGQAQDRRTAQGARCKEKESMR
jgi:hypothetical protein